MAVQYFFFLKIHGCDKRVCGMETMTSQHQSVLIERVATLGSKVTQKSSTLSSITKEFQKNSSNLFVHGL